MAPFICLWSYLRWVWSLFVWSVILKESSLCMFTWWHWVLSSKRGEVPMHIPFQGSPSVMFANVPSAKENHMVKSRFKVAQGRNRLYLLMERKSKVTLHTDLHFGRNILVVFINNLPHTYLTHFNLNYSFTFWRLSFECISADWILYSLAFVYFPMNHLWFLSFVSLKHNKNLRDFPGGPEGKTLRSQCRRPGLDPWSGN